MTRTSQHQKVVDDARLRELFDYWDRLRGERAAPAYAEVDPLAMPRGLLPFILVAEVLRDGRGRRYRFRLCGTEVEATFGRSMKGRFVDELAKGDYAAYMHRLYEKLVTSKRPIYSVSSYHNRHIWTKRLMLPLSSDNETIDVVLSGQTFFSQSKAPKRIESLQHEARDELIVQL